MARDKGQRKRDRENRGTAGLKDCGTCGGTGNVIVERAEQDEDGIFSGDQHETCRSCRGTGRIGR